MLDTTPATTQPTTEIEAWRGQLAVDAPFQTEDAVAAVLPHQGECRMVNRVLAWGTDGVPNLIAEGRVPQMFREGHPWAIPGIVFQEAAAQAAMLFVLEFATIPPDKVLVPLFESCSWEFTGKGNPNSPFYILIQEIPFAWAGKRHLGIAAKATVFQYQSDGWTRRPVALGELKGRAIFRAKQAD